MGISFLKEMIKEECIYNGKYKTKIIKFIRDKKWG